jgi:hypothetical protein
LVPPAEVVDRLIIYGADGGWLNARSDFPFDRYRDPEQMGLGPLRRSPS